jgi:membrane-associated HD superfamily phosphohydrolase
MSDEKLEETVAELEKVIVNFGSSILEMENSNSKIDKLFDEIDARQSKEKMFGIIGVIIVVIFVISALVLPRKQTNCELACYPDKVLECSDIKTVCITNTKEINLGKRCRANYCY